MKLVNYIWLFSIGSWFSSFIWIISIYSSINKIIPTNYNFSGEVTKYGAKNNLFILIGINFILILLFYFLSKNVKHLNFPIEINKSNKSIMYYRMSLFLALLSSFITIIFTIIVLKATILNSFNLKILTIILLILYVTIIFFVYKSKSNKT